MEKERRDDSALLRNRDDFVGLDGLVDIRVV